MNNARARALIPFSFFVLITSMFIVPVYADKMAVSTGKPSYILGATIDIYGTLTWLGNPVTDGLVAVGVVDPQASDPSRYKFIRVVATGAVARSWEVKVVKFQLCDAQGNPRNSFARNSDDMYFNLTVESLDPVIERQGVIAVNLFDSTGISTSVICQPFSVAPGKQFTLMKSMWIPSDAYLGAALCTLSVLTKGPEEEGYPYCPEERAELFITSSGSQPENVTSALYSDGSGGSYSLSFKMPNGADVGNYSVCAGARYNAFADVVFDYYWRLTDITRDGKVNIIDVSAVARAFGSRVGQKNYNSFADIDSNGIVNILDVSVVARDFGKIMVRV